MNEIQKYNLKLNLIVLFENCFTLGCFTTLAIIFKRWWIIFFALLFMSYVEHKKVDAK